MPEKYEQCDNKTFHEDANRAVKKVFPYWSSMSINTNPSSNSSTDLTAFDEIHLNVSGCQTIGVRAADAMHQLIGV